MDKYNILREFAESWGMFLMLFVFLLVLVRTYLRPGAKKEYAEAANIVLLRGDNLEDDLKTIDETNPTPRKETRT